LLKFIDKQSNCTAVHVNQILQKWNTSDKEICRHADQNNLVVITKDADFKNSHFISKSPKKVVRVILGNISNQELVLLFEKYLPFISPLSTKDNLYIEIDREQLVIVD
jgi:predicted nuclease of predicted toxin-antitoxin system